MSSNLNAPAWQEPFHRAMLMTTTDDICLLQIQRDTTKLCRESLSGGSNAVSYSGVSGFVSRPADYLSGLSFYVIFFHTLS
jgi:hypothetical protein